mmetsp:Transcript_43891/g.89667  ORF Transcript_43891/g.89667 Transcript_43891/m.89667 type:complete len:87 (+) Transcript_43891:437-697(+)
MLHTEIMPSAPTVPAKHCTLSSCSGLIKQTTNYLIGKSLRRISAWADDACDLALIAILAVLAAMVAMKPNPKPTAAPTRMDSRSCS